MSFDESFVDFQSLTHNLKTNDLILKPDIKDQMLEELFSEILGYDWEESCQNHLNKDNTTIKIWKLVKTVV